MTSYVTPKKNSGFVIDVGLPSIASPGIAQVDPTIAAGDFKVSIDGGALANLGTLPSVSPAGSKNVKITLSASEMNGDNIFVQGSDAAGSEWGDVLLNIQTSARQIDDLATQASVDIIDDFIDTEVAAIKTQTDKMVFTVANHLDVNVLKVGGTTQTAGDLATMITAVDDFVDTEVAAIKAKTDQLTFTAANQLDVQVLAMATDTLTAAALKADAVTEIQNGLATAAALDAVDNFVDTEIADIQARLPAALVGGRIDASVGAMAANTMTAAAAAADLTTELQSGLATAASLATVAGYLDTEIADIKAKTDNLPSDPADASVVAGLIAGLNNLSAAQVNAEVVDALNVDTYAEPGQGVPGATLSLAAKINFLYKAWRNKKTQTATTFSLYNDDAATVDQKSTTSDDGVTFTDTEKTGGP